MAGLVGAIALLVIAAAAGSRAAAELIASKQAETARARDEARANFIRAEQGRVEVDRQRHAVSVLALRLTLDRVRDLGERQQIGEGMLWMARALTMAPPDAAQFAEPSAPASRRGTNGFPACGRCSRFVVPPFPRARRSALTDQGS